MRANKGLKSNLYLSIHKLLKSLQHSNRPSLNEWVPAGHRWSCCCQPLKELHRVHLSLQVGWLHLQFPQLTNSWKHLLHCCRQTLFLLQRQVLQLGLAAITWNRKTLYYILIADHAFTLEGRARWWEMFKFSCICCDCLKLPSITRPIWCNIDDMTLNRHIGV